MGEGFTTAINKPTLAYGSGWVSGIITGDSRFDHALLGSGFFLKRDLI